MTELILAASQQKIIKEQSEAAYPRECCGLLIGSVTERIHVTEVVPTDNLAESDHRFLIDPQIQFDWIRKLRGTGRDVAGHYHSHPNGRLEPSEHDAAQALEVGQIWVIAPLVDGRVQVLQGYRVSPSAGVFEPINIRES